jgi:hypothetical protein
MNEITLPKKINVMTLVVLSLINIVHVVGSINYIVRLSNNRDREGKQTFNEVGNKDLLYRNDLGE